MPRQLARVALAAAAAGLFASGSHAGYPALEINWWVNGNLVNSIHPPGVPRGPTQWVYTGFLFDDPLAGGTGALLEYTITGDPDPLLSGNLAIEAPDDQDIDVVLEVILPISVNLGATQLAGSAALGLTTDSGGGSLSSLAGTPVWQALLDELPVGASASLFFDPFLISHSGPGSSGVSDDFGLQGPMVPGPGANDSIGIRISFNLTESDQASITSVFFVIPGPGSLIVLAAGLVAVPRRRRR